MRNYEWGEDGKLKRPVQQAKADAAPQGAASPPAVKPKRDRVQSFERYNVGDQRDVWPMSRQPLCDDERFVPVSFVAKDWKVTPRRIRSLLAAGRLAGRVQENGYWEVRYPYFFSFGTRGPALKHQQRVSAKAERRAECKTI